MLKDYEKQPSLNKKDDNKNRVDEMATMLWDIIESYESKHIDKWQMTHESMILD